MSFRQAFVTLFCLSVFLLAVSAVTAQHPFVQPGNARTTDEPPTLQVSQPSFESPMVVPSAPALQSPKLRPGTGRQDMPSSPPGIASGLPSEKESQSIIGALKNPNVTVTLATSEGTNVALSEVVKAFSTLSKDGVKVGITPSLNSETLESLSPTLRTLEWLALLLTGQSVLTLGEKSYPLVTRLGKWIASFATGGLKLLGYQRTGSVS